MNIENTNDIDIDFGDPALNDPDYEKNVEAQEAAPDGTTTDAPAEGAQQAAAPSEGEGTGTEQAGAQADARPQGDAGGQQQPAPADPNAHKQDAKGNIVDAQGNIIAKAGFERRQYEKTAQQQRYIGTLEKDLEAARKDAMGAAVLNGAPEKLGLSNEEVQMGLQAAAAFKKDPAATARWMLQEAMRMGYNLTQIVGQNAQGQLDGGSLSMDAIKGMINEAVQPLVGDREQTQRQQEIEQSATREYERFLGTHDHAQTHESVIASLMAQDRNLTPEVAYWQLREYAAKNQLDFALPLRDQVLARQQGGQAPSGHAQPSSEAQSQPQGGVQPMPNGSAAVPATDMRTQPNLAGPDDSWDSIVQQSLREAGALQ